MDEKLLTAFPYYKNPEGLYFPIVPLRLSYQTMSIDSSALIDSGATISIFRTDVAEYLRIIVGKGEEIYLGGVGGRIKGYIHMLDVEIANKKFRCPVVFSYEYLVSFNLLGRAEFFTKYRIIFEESKNFLKLE